MFGLLFNFYQVFQVQDQIFIYCFLWSLVFQSPKQLNLKLLVWLLILTFWLRWIKIHVKMIFLMRLTKWSIEFKVILHKLLQVSNLNKRSLQAVLLAFLTFSSSYVFACGLKFPWLIQDHFIYLITSFIYFIYYTFEDYHPFKNLRLFLITFCFSFFKVLPRSIIHLHFHQLLRQFHSNLLSSCHFRSSPKYLSNLLLNPFWEPLFKILLESPLPRQECLYRIFNFLFSQ